MLGQDQGDPKLITVYGLECIEKSNVILYDRLVNKQLLNHAKPEAELIFCGKRPGKHELIQEQIHEALSREGVRREGSHTFKRWRSVCIWTSGRRSRGAS